MADLKCTDWLDVQKTMVFVEIYNTLRFAWSQQIFRHSSRSCKNTQSKPAGNMNIISHIQLVLAVAHKIGRMKLKRYKCFPWPPSVPAGLCVARKWMSWINNRCPTCKLLLSHKVVILQNTKYIPGKAICMSWTSALILYNYYLIVYTHTA